MANQIVVLNTSINPIDSSFSVSGVFWLVVPTNNVVPLPYFKSQVPFIDQGTLGQLRLGTLLEQAFTSGLFPSGTTLATVQAELQTMYTAAQTALNNAACPLASLIATEYTGSAWVTVASGLVVFDPLGKLIADVGWAAAAGLVPGMTAGRATGYCSTNAVVNKMILGTPYTPQGSNGQRSFASSSAADAAAGIGAQQVTITYLDASFVVHTEVVTLNGTTPVNTVGMNYAYIESIVVTQVGSSGTNLGTISIYTGTAGGGTVWGSIAVNGIQPLSGTVTVTNGSANITFSTAQSIPAGTTLFFSAQSGVAYVLSAAVSGTTGTLTTNYTGTTSNTGTTQTGVGDNQTFWCHHYVPAGVTAYVMSMECASYAVLGTMYLAHSGNPASSNLPWVQIGPTVLHPAGDYREHDFQVALGVSGPDLIQLFTRPVSSTTDTSLGNFEWIQF